MRIDLRTRILDYEGEEIEFKENPKDEKEPVKILDLRRLFSIALNTPVQDENLGAEDKARIYALSTRIFSKPKPNFSLDDLKFLKDRAGKVCTPLMYGRICEIIDPDSVVPEEEDDPSENEHHAEAARDLEEVLEVLPVD